MFENEVKKGIERWIERAYLSQAQDDVEYSMSTGRLDGKYARHLAVAWNSMESLILFANSRYIMKWTSNHVVCQQALMQEFVR